MKVANWSLPARLPLPDSGATFPVALGIKRSNSGGLADATVTACSTSTTWDRIKFAVGFLFSAGSFIINEHLLKRFRVEERRGSDLLEFDFAAPHQAVNSIPADVINLHRFRYALAGPGAAQCNVGGF